MKRKIEDGGWREVLDSSVILQGPYDGGNYSMGDFYKGLEGALEEQVSGFILGLGPLVKSNEFYLAVNSPEIRNKLLMCGNIIVKERHFKVRSTDETRFVARVHWAPPYTPSSAIEEAMGTACRVESVKYETCKEEGYENVATGVRLVTLIGDRKKLPHLTKVTNPLNGQSYELLITVPGRAPLCLKCKRTGHFRRACQTPFCRHHNEYGHTTESCVLKKATYANAAKRNDEFAVETTEQMEEVEQPTAGNADRTTTTERPTPAPRPQPAMRSRTAERSGRAALPATRSKSTEQKGREASPAMRPQPEKRNETVSVSASGESRPTEPDQDKPIFDMSSSEIKEWVEDKVASLPSEMLENAISSEESMSDNDEEWNEVPDAEADWTVIRRKRKGSTCSDSPRQESDGNGEEIGEGSHSDRKTAIVSKGKIQKLKSPRKTQKKKH